MLYHREPPPPCPADFNELPPDERRRALVELVRTLHGALGYTWRPRDEQLVAIALEAAHTSWNSSTLWGVVTQLYEQAVEELDPARDEPAVACGVWFKLWRLFSKSTIGAALMNGGRLPSDWRFAARPGQHWDPGNLPALDWYTRARVL